MTTRIQKAIQQATLYNQTRTMGPGVANALSTFIPPTTTAGFSSYFNNNSNQMGSFFTNTVPNTFKPPITAVKLLIYTIIIILIITAIMLTYNYVISTRPAPVSVDSAAAAAASTASALAGSEGFQDSEPEPNGGPVAHKLINMQLKTLPQAAYLGNGVFDANSGIMQQLRLGARTFMLQIDYTELASVEGTTPYTPTLIMRSASGNIMSRNTSQLSDVMKYINEYAFNDTFPNYNSPVILMLHFIRLPYSISDTTNYVQYLSSVALSVSQLHKYLLTGGYYRSAKEHDIFHGNVDELNGKIVIGTNIDTSFFNRVRTEPNADLDYLTNFHYYVKDGIHVDETILYPETGYNALIYNIDTLLGMDTREKDVWVQRNKHKFTIVKLNNNANPTPDKMARLLNEFGVNCVPYDYFEESNAEYRSTVNSMYNGTSRMRPAILQV